MRHDAVSPPASSDYRYSNRPRRATITCFYIMTQTTLSAATPASHEPRRAALREWAFAQSVKNLETRLAAGSVAQACPPWGALLLAQRRVTADEGFTQRYEGPGRSCRGEREEQAHTATSHTPEILIANLELESQLTHRKISRLRIPNRKYSSVSRSARPIDFPTASVPLGCPESRRAPVDPLKLFAPSSLSPLVTHHSPLITAITAFLIYGCAIKTLRNSLKIRYLHSSNRR
jgi:hypothetical protein